MKAINSHAIKRLKNMSFQAHLVELSTFAPANIALAIGKPRYRGKTIIWALSTLMLFRSGFDVPEIHTRRVLGSDNRQKLIVWRPGEKCHFEVTR